MATANQTEVCVPLGTDRLTGDRIVWDPRSNQERKLTNQHLLILGKSGSGKTETTKALIWELDRIGVPSIIFDYHGEYALGTFRDALRPRVFDVMAGLPINPFELPLDPLTGKKRPPVEMVFRLADILNSTFRGSGGVQLGLLREAIEECYRRQGFDFQTEATWSNDPPSLSVLGEVLDGWAGAQGAQVRSLRVRLQPLFKSGIFSQGRPQSTFDEMLSRTTVIVMTSGIRDLMLAASRFLLQKIYSSMLMKGMTDRLRAMVCIDEAHKLCGDESITPLIREARKYGIGLILSSHQVRDFAPSVLANTGTIIALELEDADATMVSRYLGADKGGQQAARQIIMAQSRGQALVKSQHYQPYAQVQVLSFEERSVQAAPTDPAATATAAEALPPQPDTPVIPHNSAASARAHHTPVVPISTEWVNTVSVGTDTLFTAADLFCGAGGFSAGFEAAGYRPLLGIDCDPSALETYRYNHMDTRALLARVEDLTDGQIVGSLKGEPLDVLCGGPPCQGFSTAGKRRAHDPRNELFRQFVRVASLLQPHYVVLENVPGILSFEGGSVVEDIRRSLAEEGYLGASVVKLNAADYGVPQLRERVLVVANRHGLPNPYPLPLLRSPEYVTVGETLDPLLDCPRDPRANHIWLDHDTATVERLAALKPGESLHSTYRGSWQRLVLNRPAPTIKTNNGGSAVHPTLPRALSNREMATLQSFPTHFIFRGRLQSTGQQVGNAVPPLLARHVALALRPSLATVSHRIETDPLRQVTYEVSAAALHELREYLLKWGERTGHPVGVSQLLETIIASISPENLARVAESPDPLRVPLTCYLPGCVVEKIVQLGGAVTGDGVAADGPSLVVSHSLRHFVSRLGYTKAQMMWESHRRAAIAAP